MIEFDGFDKVVCTRARLLRLVENPFNYYDNFGKRNSGKFNSGNYNSGDCNFGSKNSGSNNSGWWNYGNWNSGNYNSGFFCIGYFYRYNIIFNELVPKDCELKFPKWIYFKLLSEGYKISWQKAFEDASIEGVKELLVLPNFDYEIFGRITSISKKQIGEKLREYKIKGG